MRSVVLVGVAILGALATGCSSSGGPADADAGGEAATEGGCRANCDAGVPSDVAVNDGTGQDGSVRDVGPSDAPRDEAPAPDAEGADVGGLDAPDEAEIATADGDVVDALDAGPGDHPDAIGSDAAGGEDAAADAADAPDVPPDVPEPACTIAGTIQLPGGVDPSGLTVSVDAATPIATTTDAAGMYALPCPPDGTYTLSFTRDAYAEHVPGVTVAGRVVTLGGEPFPTAPIEVPLAHRVLTSSAPRLVLVAPSHATVFVQTPDAGGTLALVSVANRDARVLATGVGTSPVEAAYSTDSSRVSWTRADGTLWSVPSTAGDPVQLASDAAAGLAPMPSVDGTRVLYVAGADQSAQTGVLAMVAASGGAPAVLAASVGLSPAPRATTDGNWVLYADAPGGAATVYAQPTLGGAATALAGGADLAGLVFGPSRNVLFTSLDATGTRTLYSATLGSAAVPLAMGVDASGFAFHAGYALYRVSSSAGGATDEQRYAVPAAGGASVFLCSGVATELRYDASSTSLQCLEDHGPAQPGKTLVMAMPNGSWRWTFDNADWGAYIDTASAAYIASPDPVTGLGELRLVHLRDGTTASITDRPSRALWTMGNGVWIVGLAANDRGTTDLVTVTAWGASGDARTAVPDVLDDGYAQPAYWTWSVTATPDTAPHLGVVSAFYETQVELRPAITAPLPRLSARRAAYVSETTLWSVPLTSGVPASTYVAVHSGVDAAHWDEFEQWLTDNLLFTVITGRSGQLSFQNGLYLTPGLY